MTQEQLTSLGHDLKKAYAEGWFRSWTIIKDMTHTPAKVKVKLRGVRTSSQGKITQILHGNGMDTIWDNWSSEIGTEGTADVEGSAEMEEDGTKLMVEASLGMDGYDVGVVRRENG